MSKIGDVFAKLNGKGALIAYIMGGDPNISLSRKVVEAVIAGGADIIEIGIPFSDPMADGKSIQEAAVRSLASGTTPSQVLEVVREIKKKHDIPIAIMTYYNVLYSPGLESFLQSAKKHGVDGMIIPDLPLDETADYSRLAKKNGIDTILLAASTTSHERMEDLIAHSTGFLYLVSLLGVTGARSVLKVSTVDLVKSTKKQTRGKIPLGVGFGISTPEQARLIIEAGADAAIVGSSIVNRVAEYKDRQQAMLSDVEAYIRSLKTGMG